MFRVKNSLSDTSLKSTFLLRRRMLQSSYFLITGIILAALSLRIWSAFSDPPYIFHPDEPNHVTTIQNILKTGDLNPHFFNYPSMFIYVNALAYIPYYLAGKFYGMFTTIDDVISPTIENMGTAFTQSPGSIELDRSVTILFATASVLLIFFIGRRLTKNQWVGLIAAFMMAVSPTSVYNSRFTTPDTFLVFWALLTFFTAILILQEGKKSHYILAGLFAGFTISSKYNGALIMLTVIGAHFFRTGWTGVRDRKIYLACLMCLLGFILITPFSFLDYKYFLKAIKSEAIHYAIGHPGMEGDAALWYIKYLWNIEGIACLLALVQILRGFYKHSRETMLLSVFVIPYFIFISSYVVRNDRTLLPDIPFIFLLCAILIVDLYSFKLSFLHPKRRVLIKGVAVLIMTVTFVIPLKNTIKDSIERTTIDSRTTARVWLNRYLPDGAKVAIESYSPFVNPARFKVSSFSRMIDNSSQWYIDNGFDYLVFSQGMFARFYHNPKNYKNEINSYESFFHTFNHVKSFTDGGYEIRVYKINKDNMNTANNST